MWQPQKCDDTGGRHHIEGRAFDRCALESLTIPSGVTSIDWCAFNGCEDLTSVVIPEGVTTIGQLAFGGCPNLTSITLPSTIASIADKAFGEYLGYVDGDEYAGPMPVKTIHYAGTEAQWSGVSLGQDAFPENARFVYESTGVTDPPAPTDPPEPADPPTGSLTINTSGPEPILEGITIGRGSDYTSVADVKHELEAMEPGSTIEATKPDGSSAEADNQPAATGMRVTITGADGAKRTITIVVPGDVLGTGRMSLGQLVRLAAAYTCVNPLQGVHAGW